MNGLGWMSPRCPFGQITIYIFLFIVLRQYDLFSLEKLPIGHTISIRIMVKNYTLAYTYGQCYQLTIYSRHIRYNGRPPKSSPLQATTSSGASERSTNKMIKELYLLREPVCVAAIWPSRTMCMVREPCKFLGS